MRIFETIHLLLMAGLVFGVPIAGTSRPAGQEFSWNVALQQSGVAALILILLIGLNLVVARVVSRRFSHDSPPNEDT
jgi:hypothetical protein